MKKEKYEAVVLGMKTARMTYQVARAQPRQPPPQDQMMMAHKAAVAVCGHLCRTLTLGYEDLLLHTNGIISARN